MAFKFVIISCLVALVRAGNIPAAVVAEPAVVAAPVVAAQAPLARLEEFDPSYVFGYEVIDTGTGDNKRQYEQRFGDLVKGEYSLIDPDNTRRIVTYTADSVNGFQATVQKQPLVIAESAVVAEPAVESARLAPAPVSPAAPARYVGQSPVFAQAPYSTYPYQSLAQYAYQPFARFTAAAPLAYPGTAAQVVAV